MDWPNTLCLFVLVCYLDVVMMSLCYALAGAGGKQRLCVAKASLEGREVEVTREHIDEAANGSDGEDSSLLAEKSHKERGHGVPDNEVMIVGCGYPHRGEGVVVRIVDPVTLVLQTENQVN